MPAVLLQVSVDKELEGNFCDQENWLPGTTGDIY